MSNFNTISFTELVHGNSACNGAYCQNGSVMHENNILSNGVYIQDVNGNLWKTEDWDNSVKPNAIAVVADEAKFLIALDESDLELNYSKVAPYGKYMTTISDLTSAKSDYDGAGNTAIMLKLNPCTDFAVGYCDAFVFPDGKTKGFLPSLGQLNLAYQNKEGIDAAISKCGGIVMKANYYWSSTFWDDSGSIYRHCWGLYWSDGYIAKGNLDSYHYVRPFADLLTINFR